MNPIVALIVAVIAVAAAFWLLPPTGSFAIKTVQ